jgi:excisionase family DNA binding protein
MRPSQDVNMPLLTPEQVAEQLQVSDEWVREVARRGDLASIKLGRYRRFEQSDVDAYVQTRKGAVEVVGKRP